MKKPKPKRAAIAVAVTSSATMGGTPKKAIETAINSIDDVVSVHINNKRNVN